MISPGLDREHHDRVDVHELQAGTGAGEEGSGADSGRGARDRETRSHPVSPGQTDQAARSQV